MHPLAAILLATVTSTASTEGTVHLRLGECVPSRDLVHDLVGIELGFERLLEGRAHREVRAACRDPVVVISIDPNPDALLERLVLYTDAQGEGGARLVALNIVELIQEAEIRAPALVEASPPTSLEARAATVAETGPPATTRYRLGAAPTLRQWSGPAGLAWGARASFGLDAALDAGLPWSLQWDLGLAQASSSLSLGQARTRTVDAAASAGTRLALGEAWSLLGYLGLRGGWAWIDGQSADPDAVEAGAGQGPWWGPCARLQVRYGGPIGVGLALEAGWAAQGIYGRVPEGTVGLQKGWWGAELVIDWSLGS